jgi:signal transduction histidine kinase
MRRTLGLRLSLWYAVVFIVSTVGLVALTYALLAGSLAERDHDIINATLREYASRYEAGGLPALQRAVEIEERTGQRERLFVRVLGPGADALFVTTPPGWRDFDVDDLRNARDGLGAAHAPDRDAILEVASARLIDGTILQVGKSNETRRALLRQFRVIVGWVSALTMVVGVIGGLVLTRSTLRPIDNLIQVVRNIIRTGRTNERVPASSAAETGDTVDELIALFNTMLDRITGLIGAMGESLDNVAHDLRTPLARLRGIAERALQSGDPAQHREALADCLEESDRIVSMLNTLMDISEAETGVVHLAREPVRVDALLREVVELYDHVAEAKQISVTLDAADVSVLGSRDRLRQAFANLVDNAIKYTNPHGSVTVRAFADGADAVVSVSDTGVGISPEHLPRIWERLYRADPSRSERGLGLGLSLVRAYVRAHGGRVDAASEPGRGSTFSVRLPLLTQVHATSGTPSIDVSKSSTPPN